MATKKNSGNDKAGSERFVTSASGVVVTKKGGSGRPQTVKRPGGKKTGGR